MFYNLTPRSVRLSLVMLSLGLMTMVSCSSDSSDDDMTTTTTTTTDNTGDNNNNGDDNNDDNNHQAVSQNKVNQEFFIEGIYVSSPNRDIPRTVPHSSKALSLEKEFIEEVTGIVANETTFVTVIGQRLASSSVSSSQDITRIPRSDENYDSSVIMFAVTNNDSENALVTTTTPITMTDAGNDSNGQSNLTITSGRFTFTPLTDGSVLGETLEGNPIESITFIANQNAFPENHDGSAVALYDGTETQMTFSEFMNQLFKEEGSRISVLRKVTGISGQKQQTSFYNLPQ